jgi:hypothetical protein
MDCRHPGVQDASGDIHVSLDSSAPCWNDNRGAVLKLTEAPSTSVFSKLQQCLYPRVGYAAGGNQGFGFIAPISF